MFKSMVFVGFLAFLFFGLLWIVKEKRRYLSGRDRRRDGLIDTDLPDAVNYRDDPAHEISSGHSQGGERAHFDGH